MKLLIYALLLSLLLPTSIIAKELCFLRNEGQIHDQYYQFRQDIDAKLEAKGMTLFVSSGQLHYQWYRSDSTISNTSQTYRMDVELLGADMTVKPVYENATGYTEHYYTGYSGEQGIHCRGYSKIIYKNIYPSIDWVLYIKDGTVKYDFIVHSSGAPGQIRLKYRGAELKIQEGELIASTPYGDVNEGVPYSYYLNDRSEIFSAYSLNNNIVSFDIQTQTSPISTIVIDPVLKWCSYYGGVTSEGIHATAADTAGNAIICGETMSTTNIATNGAHQVNIADSTDGYIAKFDTSGSLIWATYYGGKNDDEVYNVTTDISGNIYFTGRTHSDTGIATTGAYKDSLSIGVNGRRDAFIGKLDKNGVRQWATYFGDTVGDVGYAIKCDDYGNVYVGGHTASAQNISKGNVFQTAISQTSINSSGYLAKFTNAGSLIWSTYYNGIVLDISCSGTNVYIAGRTIDTANVASAGAFQTNCSACGGSGQVRYGFFARFDSSGSRIWGSYYNSNAYVASIAADANNNIYITGNVNSSFNGIATTGSHQTSNAAMYLAKFKANGTRQWATFYGNAVSGYPKKVHTDEKGDVYMYGTTKSTSQIATAGAYQTFLAGDFDMFYAIFSPDGSRKYGTYFGGVKIESFTDNPVYALGSSAYNNGRLYIGGSTGSSGLATTGVHQTAMKGTEDDFIARFDVDTAVYIKEPFIDTAICTGDTLFVPYGTFQQYNSNNTFTLQLSNGSGSFSSPTNIASVSAVKSGTFAAYIPTSVTQGTGYRLRIVASSPADTSYINEWAISISPKPTNFISSTNSPLCTGDTLKLMSGSSTSGVTFSWTGPNSFNSSSEDPIITNVTLAATGAYYVSTKNGACTLKDTLNVNVSQTPENITASANGPICTGDTMKLTGNSTTSGVTYQWTGANTYNQQNVIKPNAQLSDSGWYVLTATLGSCSDTAMARMVIDKAASGNIVPTPSSTICKGESVIFTAFLQNAGASPQLQWRRNGIDISGQTGSSYTNSGLSNGDAISLYIIPNTTCNSPRLSNIVTMTVNDVKTPSVQIAANPGVSLWPNQPVTFTATPTNGGLSPSYQWLRNGSPVGGATSATWGANANFMNSGDDICVVLYSDYVCPEPDTALSSCLKMDIRLGIDDIKSDTKLKIYPNPASDYINFEFEPSTAKELVLIINNTTGQNIHEIDLNSSSGRAVWVTNNIPSGMYFYQLSENKAIIETGKILINK